MRGLNFGYGAPRAQIHEKPYGPPDATVHLLVTSGLRFESHGQEIGLSAQHAGSFHWGLACCRGHLCYRLTELTDLYSCRC
jgi:hypothetical protein